VELSGGALMQGELLEEQLVVAIAPLLEGESPLVADVVLDHGQGLWALRHALTEGLRASGTVIGCDIALRRGDLATFRKQMVAELRRDHPELLVCDFGHIGDGGLHFNLVWPHAAGAIPDGLAEALRLHVSSVVVERFGGSFSAEHGIGPRNLQAYRTLTPQSVQQLAGRVQSLFAPVAIGRVNYGPVAS
jgi:FAD/FMN-containing dehydrogenase